MYTNHTLNETSGNCSLPHDITEGQWLFYYAFAWFVEGLGALLTGCLGIFFNMTTICVLLGSELASSFFNWLLVCLSVFESLFLLSGILESFRSHIGSTNLHNYVFVVFFYPFRSVVMCSSIYTTIMLAMERYNALANPISYLGPSVRSGRQSVKTYLNLHWLRLLKYIGPIVVFSTIFYIPKRMELEIENRSTCTDHNTSNSCETTYEIRVTGLRTNSHYNLWYLNISNLLVTAAIPLVLLSYLNVNIYFKLKEFIERQPLAKAAAASSIAVTQSQQLAKKREKDMVQQTRILFSIVVLFGLFHILRIVLNIEEFLTLDKRKEAKEMGCEWLQYWTIIAAPISHLLLQLNGSINFVIYCYFNKSFRDELLSWGTSASSIFQRIFGKNEEIRNNNSRESLNNLPDIRVDGIPAQHLQQIGNSSDDQLEIHKDSSDINVAIDK